MDLKAIAKHLWASTLWSVAPSFRKPRDICLCVTHRCMLKCEMCASWGKSVEDPSFPDVLTWIYQFKECGMDALNISGGEPLLRPDIYGIVDYAKGLGFKISMGTNGWLLPKKPLWVDKVNVSIDGLNPKTHDSIRGKRGSWQRAWDAVYFYIVNHKRVTINFVLQEKNYRELPGYLDLAWERGVDVNVLPLSYTGFSQSLRPDLWPKDLDNLGRILSQIKGHPQLMNSGQFIDLLLKKMQTPYHHTCKLSRLRYIVDAQGGVYPCSLFPWPMGSLEFKTLEEILEKNKPLLTKIRKEFCPLSKVCASQELDSCIQETLGYYLRLVLWRAKARLRF